MISRVLRNNKIPVKDPAQSSTKTFQSRHTISTVKSRESKKRLPSVKSISRQASVKSFSWKAGKEDKIPANELQRASTMMHTSSATDDDISYESEITETEPALSISTTTEDVKSYASSKIDIELEYLAKKVEFERQKRRKL